MTVRLAVLYHLYRGQTEPTMDTNLDIITVFNADPKGQPFYVRYDNKNYGVIEPGKARRLPRFLAKLAVKHLVDQCLNAVNQPTNNQAIRDEWTSRIVIDEEINAPVARETEEEKLARDVDRLNASSDLDRILSKHKGTQTQSSFTPPAQAMPQQTLNNGQLGQTTTPQVPQQVPASATPSYEVEENLPTPPEHSRVAESLGISTPSGEKVLKEVDNLDTPPEATPPVATQGEPTREQLYTYAEKVLGMTLGDTKTKESLDSQEIPQLIETLGYDPTAQ